MSLKKFKKFIDPSLQFANIFENQKQLGNYLNYEWYSKNGISTEYESRWRCLFALYLKTEFIRKILIPT